MLDRLKLLLESEKFLYNSNSPIIDELLNFKRNDKKLEAAPGKHDDVIMDCCFALARGTCIVNGLNFRHRKRAVIDAELINEPVKCVAAIP